MPPAFGIGGDEGDRTLDLGIANAALSQLSYVPERRKIIAGWGSGRKRKRFAGSRSGYRNPRKAGELLLD